MERNLKKVDKLHDSTRWIYTYIAVTLLFLSSCSIEPTQDRLPTDIVEPNLVVHVTEEVRTPQIQVSPTHMYTPRPSPVPENDLTVTPTIEDYVPATLAVPKIETTPNACSPYDDLLLISSIDIDRGNFHNPWGIEYYQSDIELVANEFNIPPQLFAALVDKESLATLTDPVTGEWFLGPCGAAGLTHVLGGDHILYARDSSCTDHGMAHRPTTEELATTPTLGLRYGAAILREIYDNPELGNSNWFDSLGLYNAGWWDNFETVGKGYYVDWVIERMGVPWKVIEQDPDFEPKVCMDRNNIETAYQ